MYENWIKDLKVGDEVATVTPTWCTRNYSIQKVVAITPGGRIKLDGGECYHKNGVRLGGGGEIEPVTPEILDVLERKRLYGMLNFEKFKGRLSVERLNILLQWQEELTKKHLGG